ncbi:transposase, partial [Pandoraea sputorum]|uniref:transposase n=1 Tax=Pandoraea sputorum TaxID=93222 RepID=UPI001242407F
MIRIPKASYTPEFRAEAVKLAHQMGSGEAARRLSISIKTLANWHRSDKAGELAKIGSTPRPKTEAESAL